MLYADCAGDIVGKNSGLMVYRDRKGYDLFLCDFRTQPGRNRMATVLMPLPDSDFDPTESSVSWRTMRDQRHRIVFATPVGRTARADPKMVTGEGLGIFSSLLKADANGRRAYREMEQSDPFRRPVSYGEIRAADFDALILPGGHAPGMRAYLGSEVLQSAVADFFVQKKPVGAICHGVLLAARSSVGSACRSCTAKRRPLSPGRWNSPPGR
jgi:putative intracellular protease/amidase